MRFLLEVEIDSPVFTNLPSGRLKTSIVLPDGSLRYDLLCAELVGGRFKIHDAWVEEEE